MDTVRIANIRYIGLFVSVSSDGVYTHIGIERSLFAYLRTLTGHERPIPESITLDFNIDEVSVSRSSQSVLWMIQMDIQNGGLLNPFVIGAYNGIHKPECNEFLEYFVDELNGLISNGLNYNGKFLIVHMGYFCCDTPAVSFIRGSKGHTGYNSCVKCTQRGTHLDSTLVFPYITPANKTHDDFIDRTDPEHHVKDTIVENIHNLDMVRGFPVDEMHIVHLGVMKKLIQFWSANFNKKQLKEVEDAIKIAEQFRPADEIRRAFRPLSEAARFKAKEFRNILLLTGPVILKDVLDLKQYHNFLMLHFAMRTLTSLGDNQNNLSVIDQMQNLLERFEKDFKTLYGLNKVTYVVHSLIHICDDVKQYGKVNNFSAY